MRTKYSILIILLLSTAFLIQAVGYDAQSSSRDGADVVGKIPLRLGSWQGMDVSLDERVYELLETRAIIHRTYDRPQLPAEVFLSIVYYNQSKVDFHTPEDCLGGLGLKTEREPHQVTVNYEGENIAINLYQLIQHHEGRKTLVFYFYKTGRFAGRSYLKLRLNMGFNKIAGHRPSGALIRLSTPILESDGIPAAQSRLQDFIQDIFPLVVSYL